VRLRFGGPTVLVAIAELFGTSLWFSANSVTGALQSLWGLGPSSVGWLTASTQIGFILGTAILAVTGLADRYPASKIFCLACFTGAFANAAFAASPNFEVALVFRVLVGLSLAGIYPIGMKLVVSWTRDDVGYALGLLVGMLTLGTALPHGIRALGTTLPWQSIVLASSGLAMVAGLMILRLGVGPHVVAVDRSIHTPRASDVYRVFKIRTFRTYAFGYFGHMWELYAFWTIVPWLVVTSIGTTASKGLVSGLAFGVIAIGAVGCVFGGLLARRFGGARIAVIALASSGTACVAFPLVAPLAGPFTLLLLFVWGAAVITDSPQFSSLSAQSAPREFVGGALATQNCIGFTLTVVAIALVTNALASMGAYVTWLLVPGPVLGLFALLRSRSS
jgi:MFS family permease